eukprot:scaffold3334_cov369-Prasinococcus_capsulatus_cf.AAC.5
MGQVSHGKGATRVAFRWPRRVQLQTGQLPQPQYSTKWGRARVGRASGYQPLHPIEDEVVRRGRAARHRCRPLSALGQLPQAALQIAKALNLLLVFCVGERGASGRELRVDRLIHQSRAMMFQAAHIG